ncbi:hypothetical protein KIN20_021706, partial [Parelaphostrongylus tenuis]
IALISCFLFGVFNGGVCLCGEIRLLWDPYTPTFYYTRPALIGRHRRAIARAAFAVGGICVAERECLRLRSHEPFILTIRDATAIVAV